MPKTKEEIETKIKAREAELQSTVDGFSARQTQREAARKREQDEWVAYHGQIQQKASNIEGMIMQLREDLAELPAEETLPEEPALT